MCIQGNWKSISSSIIAQQPICMEDRGNFLQSRPFFMHWQTQYILWFYWIYKHAIGIITETASRKLLYTAYKMSLYILPRVHCCLLIDFIVLSIVINFKTYFVISKNDVFLIPIPHLFHLLFFFLFCFIFFNSSHPLPSTVIHPVFQLPCHLPPLCIFFFLLILVLFVSSPNFSSAYLSHSFYSPSLCLLIFLLFFWAQKFILDLVNSDFSTLLFLNWTSLHQQMLVRGPLSWDYSTTFIFSSSSASLILLGFIPPINRNITAFVFVQTA